MYYYSIARVKPDEVGGVRVASTIRYLGTDVGDSRLCFHDYKN